MTQKFKLSFRAVLLVCGLVLFFAGIVFAYVLTEDPTGVFHDWTYQASPMGENYVVFENTSDTAGELDAIKIAGIAWNSQADFDFKYGGPGTNPAPALDGVNQIRWGTTSGSLATTTHWYNTITGDISEADCVFNDSYTWSTAAVTPTSAYDVQSVMLHEFGHYLSLDHSVPPAVMQPTISPGTQQRILTSDDADGIRAIYGSSCSTMGLSANVISPRPRQAIVNGVLLFSPLLLVLLVRVFLPRKRTSKSGLLN